MKLRYEKSKSNLEHINYKNEKHSLNANAFQLWLILYKFRIIEKNCGANNEMLIVVGFNLKPFKTPFNLKNYIEHIQKKS